MISLLENNAEEKEKLRDFLCNVFGKAYKKMAEENIEAMFQTGLSKPYFCLARKEGEIIGSAAISEALFTENTWGIGWVAVHEKYRLQGIGHKLMQFSLKEIIRRNPPEVTAILSVYPDIAPFYEKLGFKGASTDHTNSLFLTKRLRAEK